MLRLKTGLREFFCIHGKQHSEVKFRQSVL